jgi:hypothetical protein
MEIIVIGLVGWAVMTLMARLFNYSWKESLTISASCIAFVLLMLCVKLFAIKT